MDANILIIEDEERLADLIAVYLKNEGMRAVCSYDGRDAIEKIESNNFDLVLIDINLPGKDGFEVLSALRAQHATPAIILSARDADEDKILALGLGADEYVTKPFSPKVLVAQVRANLRRARGGTRPNPVTFGPYAFQPDTFMLTRENEPVRLSAKEFDVLKTLIDAEGKPVRAENIYRSVWGEEGRDFSTIGVYIQRLRRKLEPEPAQPRYIETIPGRGYRVAV